MTSQNKYVCAAAVACLLGASLWALERPHASPHVGKDYPRRVYWGDTHVHTNLSVDAFGWGSTLSPEDAYRYALGHVVEGPGGVRMQLRRPLDFLVVADHAENLGLFAELEAGNQALLATESGAQWYQRYREALPALNAYRASKKPKDPAKRSVFPAAMRVQIGDAAFRRSVWERVTRTADRYNEPGKFTAFIGYEWTPIQILLHRVVVFKDGAAKASELPPFSQLDSTRPEDL